MAAFQWFIREVLEQTVMRFARLGIVGGMAALLIAPMALAQDDVAVPDTQAASVDAVDAQPPGSDLLGPGEEGIGPLAGAPQPAEPAVEASADSPPLTAAAPVSKAAAVKPRHSTPARTVRRTKGHPQG